MALITDSGIKENPDIISFLKKSEENAGSEETYWHYRFRIDDEKLGNSIFLFYEMNWDDAIKLLKRGTLNVLIGASADSVIYHFYPLNADAELTYLKLSGIIGYGEVQ